jgi:hypothetical protein
MIRVLKKIEANLLDQLKQSLDEYLIRQYLKTNFQRRKLKLYSGETLLNF